MLLLGSVPLGIHSNMFANALFLGLQQYLLRDEGLFFLKAAVHVTCPVCDRVVIGYSLAFA
jgi:hypothetical protein